MNNPPAPLAAKGTLGGAGGSCTGLVLYGTYKKDVSADTSNYLTVAVNVTAPGSYTISSDTINGLYFRDAGTFTITGITNVKLKAGGKPLLTGVDMFSLSYDSSKCSFEVAVVDGNNKIGSTVFIGSTDGNMYALDAVSGKLKWKFATSGIIVSSPTVMGNLVIFGSADRTLYAVNAITGLLEWKFYTGSEPTGGVIQQTPAAGNGILYFSCENGKLYAIDTTVQILNGIKYPGQKWQSVYGNVPGVSNAAPTFANGLVYTGASDNTCYAYDALTGKQQWKYALNEASNRSNPVVSNNVVYLFTQNSTVYALQAATGVLIWQKNTDNGYGTGSYFSSPTVANGTLYVASTYMGASTNQVCAMDITNGAIRWFSDAPPQQAGIIVGGLAVYNGRLYGGSDNGYLYAWDAATGKLQWTYNTMGTHIYSSPTVANDIVYIAGENSTVHALNAATGLLKWKTKISNDRIVYSAACVVDLAGVVHHPGDSGEQN